MYSDTTCIDIGCTRYDLYNPGVCSSTAYIDVGCTGHGLYRPRLCSSTACIDLGCVCIDKECALHGLYKI